MNKKIITTIAALCLTALPLNVSATASETTSTSASASGIDLSNLSLEQLMDLKRELNIMIAEKGGDNIIGRGKYEVGVDIKPGRYNIVRSTSAYKESGMLFVDVYLTKEDYDNGKPSKRINLYSDENNLESASLNLKDENILVLDGEGMMYETSPSWAVE